MQTKKRASTKVISVLLALVMVVTTMPNMNAKAANEQSSDSSSQTSTVEESESEQDQSSMPDEDYSSDQSESSAPDEDYFSDQSESSAPDEDYSSSQSQQSSDVDVQEDTSNVQNNLQVDPPSDFIPTGKVDILNQSPEGSEGSVFVCFEYTTGASSEVEIFQYLMGNSLNNKTFNDIFSFCDKHRISSPRIYFAREVNENGTFTYTSPTTQTITVESPSTLSIELSGMIELNNSALCFKNDGGSFFRVNELECYTKNSPLTSFLSLDGEEFQINDLSIHADNQASRTPLLMVGSNVQGTIENSTIGSEDIQDLQALQASSSGLEFYDCAIYGGVDLRVPGKSTFVFSNCSVYSKEKHFNVTGDDVTLQFSNTPSTEGSNIYSFVSIDVSSSLVMPSCVNFYDNVEIMGTGVNQATVQASYFNHKPGCNLYLTNVECTFEKCIFEIGGNSDNNIKFFNSGCTFNNCRFYDGTFLRNKQMLFDINNFATSKGKCNFQSCVFEAIKVKFVNIDCDIYSSTFQGVALFFERQTLCKLELCKIDISPEHPELKPMVWVLDSTTMGMYSCESVGVQYAISGLKCLFESKSSKFSAVQEHPEIKPMLTVNDGAKMIIISCQLYGIYCSASGQGTSFEAKSSDFNAMPGAPEHSLDIDLGSEARMTWNSCNTFGAQFRIINQGTSFESKSSTFNAVPEHPEKLTKFDLRDGSQMETDSSTFCGARILADNSSFKSKSSEFNVVPEHPENPTKLVLENSSKMEGNSDKWFGVHCSMSGLQTLCKLTSSTLDSAPECIAAITIVKISDKAEMELNSTKLSRTDILVVDSGSLLTANHSKFTEMMHLRICRQAEMRGFSCIFDLVDVYCRDRSVIVITGEVDMKDFKAEFYEQSMLTIKKTAGTDLKKGINGLALSLDQGSQFYVDGVYYMSDSKMETRDHSFAFISTISPIKTLRAQVCENSNITFNGTVRQEKTGDVAIHVSGDSWADFQNNPNSKVTVFFIGCYSKDGFRLLQGIMKEQVDGILAIHAIDKDTQEVLDLNEKVTQKGGHDQVFGVTKKPISPNKAEITVQNDESTRDQMKMTTTTQEGTQEETVPNAKISEKISEKTNASDIEQVDLFMYVKDFDKLDLCASSNLKSLNVYNFEGANGVNTLNLNYGNSNELKDSSNELTLTLIDIAKANLNGKIMLNEVNNLNQTWLSNGACINAGNIFNPSDILNMEIGIKDQSTYASTPFVINTKKEYVPIISNNFEGSGYYASVASKVMQADGDEGLVDLVVKPTTNYVIKQNADGKSLDVYRDETSKKVLGEGVTLEKASELIQNDHLANVGIEIQFGENGSTVKVTDATQFNLEESMCRMFGKVEGNGSIHTKNSSVKLSDLSWGNSDGTVVTTEGGQLKVNNTKLTSKDDAATIEGSNTDVLLKGNSELSNEIKTNIAIIDKGYTASKQIKIDYTGTIWDFDDTIAVRGSVDKSKYRLTNEDKHLKAEEDNLIITSDPAIEYVLTNKEDGTTDKVNLGKIDDNGYKEMAQGLSMFDASSRIMQDNAKKEKATIVFAHECVGGKMIGQLTTTDANDYFATSRGDYTLTGKLESAAKITSSVQDENSKLCLSGLQYKYTGTDIDAVKISGWASVEINDTMISAEESKSSLSTAAVYVDDGAKVSLNGYTVLKGSEAKGSKPKHDLCSKGKINASGYMGDEVIDIYYAGTISQDLANPTEVATGVQDASKFKLANSGYELQEKAGSLVIVLTHENRYYIVNDQSNQGKYAVIRDYSNGATCVNVANALDSVDSAWAAIQKDEDLTKEVTVIFADKYRGEGEFKPVKLEIVKVKTENVHMTTLSGKAINLQLDIQEKSGSTTVLKNFSDKITTECEWAVQVSNNDTVEIEDATIENNNGYAIWANYKGGSLQIGGNSKIKGMRSDIKQEAGATISAKTFAGDEYKGGILNIEGKDFSDGQVVVQDVTYNTKEKFKLINSDDYKLKYDSNALSVVKATKIKYDIKKLPDGVVPIFEGAYCEVYKDDKSRIGSNVTLSKAVSLIQDDVTKNSLNDDCITINIDPYIMKYLTCAQSLKLSNIHNGTIVGGLSYSFLEGRESFNFEIENSNIKMENMPFAVYNSDKPLINLVNSHCELIGSMIINNYYDVTGITVDKDSSIKIKDSSFHGSKCFRINTAKPVLLDETRVYDKCVEINYTFDNGAIEEGQKTPVLVNLLQGYKTWFTVCLPSGEYTEEYANNTVYLKKEVKAHQYIVTQGTEKGRVNVIGKTVNGNIYELTENKSLEVAYNDIKADNPEDQDSEITFAKEYNKEKGEATGTLDVSGNTNLLLISKKCTLKGNVTGNTTLSVCTETSLEGLNWFNSAGVAVTAQGKCDIKDCQLASGTDEALYVDTNEVTLSGATKLKGVAKDVVIEKGFLSLNGSLYSDNGNEDIIKVDYVGDIEAGKTVIAKNVSEANKNRIHITEDLINEGYELTYHENELIIGQVKKTGKYIVTNGTNGIDIRGIKEDGSTYIIKENVPSYSLYTYIMNDNGDGKETTITVGNSYDSGKISGSLDTGDEAVAIQIRSGTCTLTGQAHGKARLAITSEAKVKMKELSWTIDSPYCGIYCALQCSLSDGGYCEINDTTIQSNSGYGIMNYGTGLKICGESNIKGVIADIQLNKGNAFSVKSGDLSYKGENTIHVEYNDTIESGKTIVATDMSENNKDKITLTNKGYKLQYDNGSMVIYTNTEQMNMGLTSGKGGNINETNSTENTEDAVPAIFGESNEAVDTVSADSRSNITASKTSKNVKTNDIAEAESGVVMLIASAALLGILLYKKQRKDSVKNK